MRARCGGGANWIGTAPECDVPRAAPAAHDADHHDGRNKLARTTRPCRAAAIAAPANLPADADDADVDRPSHHRFRQLLRHAAVGLVVDRRGEPQCLCQIPMVREFLDRPADPVRLHLERDPPHARRHSPPDLGHRSRLWTERARMAGRSQPGRIDRDHDSAVDLHHAHDGNWVMTGPEHIRTPLGRVLGRGAAKSGTEHFWHQRLTAVANVPLTIAAICILITLLGRNQAAVAQILGSPAVSIIMLLFIGSITVHMRIGMAAIIEDYVHDESAKLTLLMANTFFAIAVGLAAVCGLLKLSF